MSVVGTVKVTAVPVNVKSIGVALAAGSKAATPSNADPTKQSFFMPSPNNRYAGQ